MLGDWLTSLLTQNFKNRTDHRALDARGLVVRFVETAPTTERYMLGDWSISLFNCRRALYARGLVDQPTNLRVWGLHRPPSTIRSGTGRPAHQFENSGTVPTTERICSGTGRLVYSIAYEHDMLGDW